MNPHNPQGDENWKDTIISAMTKRQDAHRGQMLFLDGAKTLTFPVACLKGKYRGPSGVGIAGLLAGKLSSLICSGLAAAPHSAHEQTSLPLTGLP